MSDDNFFPMMKSNRWIYKTDQGSILLQVSHEEEVLGKRYFVLEAATDDETIQTEKYMLDQEALWLYSRSFGETIFFYDPPYPVIHFPLEVGKAWQWKGSCGTQPLELEFYVMAEEELEVPAGTFVARKVTVQEHSPLGGGSAIRWYAEGIGMVREEASSDLMEFSAELESYEVPP